MGGFSYPAPIDFDEVPVDHEQQQNTTRTFDEVQVDNEQQQNTTRTRSRQAPSRSKSADALRRPARNLPKTKSGRHLPKPGGPTSSKHRKAPGKSRSGDDLDGRSHVNSYSSDSETPKNSDAADDMNHGGRHSESSSSGLVTPTKKKTKKKKSSSLRKILTPSPSGKRTLKGFLTSPRAKDSLPSKKPPLSPTPGTPSQRKPRSLKMFFTSPIMRAPTKKKSGSELDNMRESLVDLHPLPDEGTRQVEGGRTARTARTARTKRKSKSEHSSDKPRSFKELLAHSHHSQPPTHTRSSNLEEMRQNTHNKPEREPSLSPEELSKPLSGGLITGLLDSVGHLVQNFLDDEDTDDEDERVSTRFDDNVSRIAGWAG
jgi:hypothetical protein